jgi:hypothetical protein
VTHTHALFAEQSQSILDDLMEIIEPELSMQWLNRGCVVGAALRIIRGRQVEVVRRPARLPSGTDLLLG